MPPPYHISKDTIMAMSTMVCNPLPTAISAGANRAVCAFQCQQLVAEPSDSKSLSHHSNRLAESFSNLLHLDIKPAHTRNDRAKFTNFSKVSRERHSTTPTMSPKEIISSKWQEIQGAKDWHDLLDPLHPWLRREIIKYGEFAQATYEAFNFDSSSEYCGSCRYNRKNLFQVLGLQKHGYKATKYIYAMSHMDLPLWLERSHLLDSWSNDSNWMGYVAVSDDEETRRIGRRDIVVAWRGTVSPTEWYEDFQRKLEPVDGNCDNAAKVEHGFRSIYTSKSDKTRYNKSSASEQVMQEIDRLVKTYKEAGEQVSLTITGHSLGGALALLNAYEAGKTHPGLPISVVSFGAPRAGNIGFRQELEKMNVKTLRVVTKQDMVPKMPGILFNESLQKMTRTLDWVYAHVGVELKVDVQDSPFLKHGFNLSGFHSLETYLHLVDGMEGRGSGFRAGSRRDFALVNKACDMLVDELRIPRCWYQLANKGLMRNDHGRWVKPARNPEDIPSPCSC